MGMKFKPGDVVRQVVKTVEGTVKAPVIIDNEVHHVVQWFEGELLHERTFTEDQLEHAPAQAAPEAEAS